MAAPHILKQQEIVGHLEGLFALADQIEARFAQARGQVDELTPSLLAAEIVEGLEAELEEFSAVEEYLRGGDNAD
jgi:hypothetical protein